MDNFWSGFEKQSGFRVQSMEEMAKLKKLLKPDAKQTAHLQAARQRVEDYLKRKNLPGHSAASTANTAAGKGLPK